MNERELFEALCEKYGAKKNAEGIGLVIKDGNDIKPIKEVDIKDILGLKYPTIHATKCHIVKGE